MSGREVALVQMLWDSNGWWKRKDGRTVNGLYEGGNSLSWLLCVSRRLHFLDTHCRKMGSARNDDGALAMMAVCCAYGMC